MGQYRLTARVGSGGMGVVYLGVAPDGGLVAVKVLRPELADDPEFRRRFGREVAVLTRVEGLCTVRVIEADTKSDLPFMVTEYVDGPSLAEYLDEYGCLNADMLYGLATGLAEALTVIHAAGIIHRDLKPSNVILAADGPKVIDFGIAQTLDGTSVTKTGMMVGSPGFIAPEQITGRPGPAADIFVWGLTIGYAAVGRSPFGTGETDAVMYRVLYQEPDIAAIPDSLKPLVAAALSKDPKNRPAAHELLDQLTSKPARAARPARPAPKTGRRYDSPTQTVLARTWPEPPREPDPSLPQPSLPQPSVPAARGSLLLDPEPPGARPARRRVSRRTTIGATATVIVLAVAATLVAFLHPGHSLQNHLAGNNQANPASVPASTVLPAYPGQQQRGVRQTISRIVSVGGTMVTTGAQTSEDSAQTSDDVIRQQFYTSTDGGLSWHLAPEQLPGGGQPPLGYTATRIAGGPNGWMAAGPQAIWTSPNGLSWTLAATHGIAQPGDSVLAVTNTADGFLAIGDGGNQAVIWLSHDGVSWQRETATQLGLKKASGAVPSSLSFAATKGHDTVISDQESAWLSTGAGSAWTSVTIPVDHGAQNKIQGVSFDGSGLIVVRSGQTASRAPDGVAYFSPNGQTWQYAGTIDPSGGWNPSVVKGSNYGFVVTGTTSAGQYAAYTSTGTGASWLPTGSLGAVSSVTRDGLVPTVGPGGNVVAVGSTRASALSQQAILVQAKPGGTVHAVRLATVPEATVTSTATAGGEQIAVGSADGYPAIWRKTSSGSWALASPRSLVSGITGRAQLTSVTHGSAGWLAVGFPGPVVFTSSDGSTWKAGHGVMVQDLAGVVSISAAAGPLGYVIVGSKLKSSGGGYAADVYWSPNLTSWTEAEDVNPQAGSNVVLAIAAGPHGFVSVGSRDGLPIVWTSPNGRDWATAKLPVAPRAYQGRVDHVAISGNRVVVTGIQVTETGRTTRTMPLTELYAAVGTGWQLVPFGSVTPGTTITAITETSGGFTAASQLSGPAGTQDAALWTSATGASWTQASVTGLSGGGTHAITALAPVGPDASAVAGIDSVETNTSQEFVTVSLRGR